MSYINSIFRRDVLVIVGQSIVSFLGTVFANDGILVRQSSTFTTLPFDTYLSSANIDGGTASSIYVLDQNVNGGGA